MTPSQRARLELLAAELVLEANVRAEDVVTVATELVAEGLDDEGLVELACLPSDVALVSWRDVEEPLRTALDGLGVRMLSRHEAGWVMARRIATGIIDGSVPARVGADRLWWLTDSCGDADELVAMLQLHDAWETSVGAEQRAVETAMVERAHDVIAAADRRRGPDAAS